MKERLVFTGGGTAGHVTPNLALIERAIKEGFEIAYIGSKNSVEETIIKKRSIDFYAISSGKLRRYFSLENVLDAFRVLRGIGEAYRLLRKLQASLIFSKGGFVSFPVIVAAYLNRIPVIAHESDMSPGLANRMSLPFVNKMCLGFAAAKKGFKNKQNLVLTGTPIREALFHGEKEKGLALCGFSNKLPCLLVMGGSLGALHLNQVVRESLTELNARYQVIHLCGKGKLDLNLKDTPLYHQFEYADREMADLLAAADAVISRAGANSVYELLALKKPHILIPLSLKSSRGDQIQNAKFFADLGISRVINEEALNSRSLIRAVDELASDREDIIAKINTLGIESGTEAIMNLIKEQLHVTA